MPPAHIPPSRRRGLCPVEGAEEELVLGQSAPRPRARARLGCSFGCPCCGPSTGTDRTDNSAALRQSLAAQRLLQATSGGVRQTLVAQAAAVDGNRDVPYVDSHCHLEMMLQKVRWYDSAPSLLEPCYEQLTDEERQCWRLLGWTREQWHGRKGTNTIWWQAWNLLSPAQSAAAVALGWTPDSWKGCDWPLPMDKEWEELSGDMRRHLATLGESCDTWDEMFGKRKPAGLGAGGDMRTWEELSPDEQRAAEKLGFSAQTWDMLEMSDVQSFITDFCGSGFQGCITQGCDGDSIDDCQKLALAHPKVFVSFGCHPKNAWLYEEDRMEERCLAALEACGPKVVAWGEFGLDFSNDHWGDKSDYRATQCKVFEKQLSIALSKELPMVLHIRDAADDSLRILKQIVPPHWKAHVHSYLGPAWFVTAILDFFPNFYFGITGTVSMGGDGARMARDVPLDKMLLETDGPYMNPRGTFFNHVGQIPLIARLVAEVRGCSSDEVAMKARANSRFIYGV